MINMKQQYKKTESLNFAPYTIIVPPSLEYMAAVIIGIEPNKEAMKRHIDIIEKKLEKINNNLFYKILNKLKII